MFEGGGIVRERSIKLDGLEWTHNRLCAMLVVILLASITLAQVLLEDFALQSI